MVRKIERPRGIFPSLPGGMDRVAKSYVDACIAGGHPVHWLNDLPGAAAHSDRKLISKIQNWKTGLRCEVQTPQGPVAVSGALDEVIVWENGTFSPWDYKTKGSEPESLAKAEADSRKYYGHQLDVYSLMMQDGIGWKLNPDGIFTYLWPAATDLQADDAWFVQFAHMNVAIDIDPARGVDLVKRATACVSSATEPASSEDCDMCNWLVKRKS
jgi:hypothetical protein